jgi:hypothetical protein
MIKALLLLWAVNDIPATVAVEMAYALLQPAPVVAKCCGQCKNGIITHGDGHKTQCPCPPTCVCKTKSVLKPECETCPSPRSK